MPVITGGMEGQSRLARAASRVLAGAWRIGLLPRPLLYLDRLERAALRFEGEAGPVPGTHWREPLDTLLEDLRGPARLTQLGQALAWGQIVRLLRERIRADRLWRGHPEILERRLHAPVLIVGHMRSGTTRLHRLLACDDRLAHNRFFETMAPVPPNRRHPVDRRRIEAKAILRVLGQLNPEFTAVHPTGADEPEEEYGLLSLSFYGAQFEAQWEVPGFVRYWQTADRRPVYEEFRRLLQTLGWSRREPEERPMVLKLPQFMEDLDPVLSALPGARLIRLHRDPVAVVGSSASLIWNQRRVHSAETDRQAIGRAWLERTMLREGAVRDVIAARPDVERIDVGYEEMNADWRAAMRRIYAFLGLPFTPALEERMRRYLEAADRSGFRHHRYDLATFGLDAERVKIAFEASGFVH